MQAVAFGLDTLKVFPAKALGGPAFLKALLKGPFPNLKLIPTGGVCLNHVQEYWDAGAFAVGCGSDLVPRQAVEQRNASLIRAQSANYLNLLRSGC
jgi:2-dehydro-3-deoxyphosphogluconate aldolase/(4S)-4-hydroxy-2-oxoglutarate aldolase